MNLQAGALGTNTPAIKLLKLHFKAQFPERFGMPALLPRHVVLTPRPPRNKDWSPLILAGGFEDPTGSQAVLQAAGMAVGGGLNNTVSYQHLQPHVSFRA